jgi:hypothetical protein
MRWWVVLAVPSILSASLLCHGERVRVRRCGRVVPARGPDPARVQHATTALGIARHEASAQRAPASPALDSRATLPEAAFEHEVRDLVAAGYAIERLASLVTDRCDGLVVTPRVNILELRGSMNSQLRAERLLEDLRRVNQGDRELRRHPIADLVSDVDVAPLFQLTQVSVSDESSTPLFGSPEPRQAAWPPKTEVLMKAVRAVFADADCSGYAVNSSEKNRVLLVFADRVTQDEVARYLDDLRAAGRFVNPR